MPGLLIMNHDSGAASGSRDGENKKRDFEGKLINGGRHDAPGTPTVNGAPSQGPSSAPPVSAPLGPAPETYSELPPEIAHIPEEHLHPLSTLLLRISQETYNELFDTLHSMAEIPVGPQTNGLMPNGLGAHGGGQENAEANRRKKLLLMKFAQDNRAKFIKLLVLTEWGKKASKDVSQLIDLLAWAREQSAHMDFVDVQIERIKQYSGYAAERNPDIRTALEVLSTGKADWMPTLGFIPPEPITPEQALKLLRYINTSLSIRLNVHETLPQRLQNWRVRSGRATFVIENELEFDVISFTEDASQQWWFLDVRLLFSPAPVITVNSHFYNRVKFQADKILKQEGEKGGLTGLFDFFCNWMLTHKITVLRSQAMKLVGSIWAGSLKVENVHRELVVSYWTNRPGKKNWIEIGVSVNKPSNGKISWRGPPLPSLTVRWFRQGVEVKGVDFGFDWHKLSFERVIKRVIAYHINDILRTTQQHIDPQITAHASLSDTEPADSKLEVTLGTGKNSATLCLEPVTGSYIVQPATSWSALAESAFNGGRPPDRRAFILTDLLAQTLRESVQKYAQQLGWRLIPKASLHPDVIKAAIKRNALQYSLYSPRGWSAEWVLANVVDALGSSWWILEVTAKGSAIDHAEEIKMERPDGSILDVNRSTLASLARAAVQIVSFRVTARQLEKEKKAYKMQIALGEARASAEPQRMIRGWQLYMHSDDVLTKVQGQQPWLMANLAITCHGLRQQGGSLWHIATGKMVESAAEEMYRLMSASAGAQKFFKFAKDGRFNILLSTPFGKDILGELRARLRDVNRLRSFAATLKKRGMVLVSSSLQRVEFQYGSEPHRAAVMFSAEKAVTLELKRTNPHRRVLKYLTELANERVPSLPLGLNSRGDSNGLDRLCTTLALTRPLVKALNEIEAATTTNVGLRNPAIFAHSLFQYRLTYENPICTFDLCVQVKDDGVYWLLEDNFLKHGPDMRPTPERNPTHRRLENLQSALKVLFSATGKGWWGTRKGFFVEVDAVGEALKQLNDTVLKYKMEGGYKAPPPLPVPAQAPAQALQQQVNGQQTANQQQQRAQQQVNNQQQAANQQQARAQQQAQAQAQARQQQQQVQQNLRRQSQQNQQQRQMPNGRPHQNQQNQVNRSRQQQDIIEID